MNEKKIDWESLSWVEYSSGIEVLYLAKFFRKRKNTHKAIIRHALDEYRHGTHFRNFAKEFIGLNKINANISLTEIGGLKNSKFPILENQLIDVCAYLKVGEQRAWASNGALIALCEDKKIVNVLKEIQSDEANHESGLDSYLRQYPIKSKYYFYKHKLKFIFVDFTATGAVKQIKNITEEKILQLLFAILPQKSLSLIAHDSNLAQLITSKKNTV